LVNRASRNVEAVASATPNASTDSDPFVHSESDAVACAPFAVDVAVEIHVDRVRSARHEISANQYDQHEQPTGFPATNIGATVVTRSNE